MTKIEIQERSPDQKRAYKQGFLAAMESANRIAEKCETLDDLRSCLHAQLAVAADLLDL